MFIRLVIGWLLVSSLLAQTQGQVWQRSALAHPGLHHSAISGRFVDGEGKPVSGIHVQIVEILNPPDYPTMRTSSGADGRFRFADVSTMQSIKVAWFPPEDWVRAEMPVLGNSFEDIDLGAIELIPNTVIRIKLERTGGKPLSKNDDLTVFLEGDAGNWAQRRMAEKRGGYWVLQQIPFRKGRWRIDVYGGDRAEHYSGNFVVTHGRRDQLIHVRLLENTLKPVDELHVGHEVLWGEIQTTEDRMASAPRIGFCETSGSVLAPDGTPLQNALVFGLTDDSEPSWLLTGASGRYQFRYRDERCEGARAALGEFWSVVSAGKAATVAPSSRHETIRIGCPAHLDIKTSGVDSASVRAFWLRRAIGWVPFAGTRAWIDHLFSNEHPIVKVEAPGYVPVIREVQLPELRFEECKHSPARGDALFAFDSRTTREIEVTGADKPLPDAIVDLEWIKNLRSAEGTMLATYRTGSDGRLSLLGGADEHLDAFIYAPGYAPARSVWEPGHPLRIDMVPLNARLLFSDLRPGQSALVSQADNPAAARLVQWREGATAEISLPAGEYDVETFGKGGWSLTDPIGYERIAVGAGVTRSANADADHRPTLILRYPEEGWRAMVYVQSSDRPLFWTSEVFSNNSAVLERESPDEAVYRLSRAGPVFVEVGNHRLDHALWREFVSHPGETITLDVPKGDAILQGSTRTYGGGITAQGHGWASPRLLLISQDPATWSVTSYLPMRDAQYVMTIRDLPAGAYYVHQHLTGEVRDYRDGFGNEIRNTLPVYAWGGIPVELRAGETTRLSDFADYAFGGQLVIIQNTLGEPLEGATLRVRDRMSERWHLFNDDEVSGAADKLPYPPAVRVRQGKAVLPSIRAGQLELYVELDDGRVYPFTVLADSGQILKLRLPPDGPDR